MFSRKLKPSFQLYAVALSAVLLALSQISAASAKHGDFTIETGQGEGFQVKHNLLGQRNFKLQDRLGDRVSKDKDFLGNSQTDISLLGNEFQRKKNIFGNKSVKASDMFGDKIDTRRSWFGLGRRKTVINLSGSAGLVSRAFSKKSPLANFNPAANSQIGSAFPNPTDAAITPPVTGIPGVNKGAE